MPYRTAEKAARDGGRTYCFCFVSVGCGDENLKLGNILSYFWQTTRSPSLFVVYGNQLCLHSVMLLRLVGDSQRE